MYSSAKTPYTCQNWIGYQIWIIPRKWDIEFLTTSYQWKQILSKIQITYFFDELCYWLSFLQTIFVGLGVKNQLILVKTIDFSLLVPQKLAIESSINNNVYYQKKVSKLPTYKIHLTMEIISYISGSNGVRVMSG